MTAHGCIHDGSWPGPWLSTGHSSMDASVVIVDHGRDDGHTSMTGSIVAFIGPSMDAHMDGPMTSI